MNKRNSSKKENRIVKLLAKLLVLTLFVGALAAIPCDTAQAATNKGLRMKVSFNGKREGDAAYDNNCYGFLAQYTKTSKLKKNMTVSGKVYVPVSALKKNGDIIHINVWEDLITDKKGEYIGSIESNYTIMLIKDGKKLRLAKWNASKEKEEKIGNLATYKKSGDYYVITLKNVPLENKYRNNKGKKVSLNTKTAYKIAQGISVTGTCSKVSNKYVYVDDRSIKAASTLKITFDKKDYKWEEGFYKGKARSVKVTTIK